MPALFDREHVLDVDLVAPLSPAQTVSEVADRLDDEGVDQTADFVDGQLDQCGVGGIVGSVGGGADRQDGEGGQGEGGGARSPSGGPEMFESPACHWPADQPPTMSRSARR
ncbi:hypothetical protein [Micromonospora psammae]|uniref:hypothetical protein n=1 Tax=Micromonospora sp. CPCC 205556 TaxID=3122398 RepID=UPI003FA532C4